VVKSNTFTFNLSDEMKQNLDEISEETGLTKSSIVRRGLHEQLSQLEG